MFFIIEGIKCQHRTLEMYKFQFDGNTQPRGFSTGRS
jgi:hypothetical protein